MQNDKFKLQTVANTRQMVPARNPKKKSQTCSKKILKLFHTHLEMVYVTTYGEIGDGLLYMYTYVYMLIK